MLRAVNLLDLEVALLAEVETTTEDHTQEIEEDPDLEVGTDITEDAAEVVEDLEVEREDAGLAAEEDLEAGEDLAQDPEEGKINQRREKLMKQRMVKLLLKPKHRKMVAMKMELQSILKLKDLVLVAGTEGDLEVVIEEDLDQDPGKDLNEVAAETVEGGPEAEIEGAVEADHGIEGIIEVRRVRGIEDHRMNARKSRGIMIKRKLVLKTRKMNELKQLIWKFPILHKKSILPIDHNPHPPIDIS